VEAVEEEVKFDAAPPPHPVTVANRKRANEQMQISEIRFKSRLRERGEVIDSSYFTHLG